MNQGDAIRTKNVAYDQSNLVDGWEYWNLQCRLKRLERLSIRRSSRETKQITFELYDAQDRHVEVVFHPGRDAAASIPQADVNRVLLTLSPIDRVASKSDKDDKSVGPGK